MADQPIPEEVREFLLAHIDSIAQLEALILLRTSSERSWDARALAGRLYVSEKEAADALITLQACELVAKDGASFRYHPRDDQYQELVNKVAVTYARSLVPVTRLIHEKGLGLRKFADAFKFWRDK